MIKYNFIYKNYLDLYKINFNIFENFNYLLIINVENQSKK
jgi:hypothetical protein